MPLPPFLMTSMAFWMNGRFDECVLQEVSGACVETKTRSIEVVQLASSVVTTPCKFALPVQAAKPLAVASRPVNKAIVLLCVFTNTLTTKLNQKLTKADTSYGTFTRRKKTYVITWGLKRGEGVYSKGAYFRELMVFAFVKSL